MTILDYRRHGKKDGERISEEGLNEAWILAHRNSTVYSVAFGGPIPRTFETLAAFLAGNNYEIRKVSPMIPDFGDAELFQGWFSNGFREAVAEAGTNINGLRKILSGREFSDAQNVALNGVKNCFEAIPENARGIAFGHSPIIDLAAEAVGHSMMGVTQLRELEGIRFVKGDHGSITVEELLLLE